MRHVLNRYEYGLVCVKYIVEANDVWMLNLLKEFDFSKCGEWDSIPFLFNIR